MQGIPVSCSLREEVFDAGDVVTALIRIRSLPTEALLFSQAVGVIQLDKRWVKTPPTQSMNPTAMHEILPPHLHPSSSSQHTSVMFITTREALPLTHVCDEGVYIQFELPSVALPSFTGIAGSISYYIGITLHIQEETLRAYFPFRVYGTGTSTISDCSPSPQTVFAAAALSYDTFIAGICNLTSSESSTFSRRNRGGMEPGIHMFSIRDEKSVCAVTLHGPRSPDAGDGNFHLTARPGDCIRMYFDFSNAEQECWMVRARLVQREKHPDGSRLQERVLDEHSRGSSHALKFSTPLNIPTSVSPAFYCPGFSVDFCVEVEFFLGDVMGKTRKSPEVENSKVASLKSDESLTWSFGLDVVSPASGNTQSLVAHGSNCHYVDPDAVMVVCAS